MHYLRCERRLAQAFMAAVKVVALISALAASAASAASDDMVVLSDRVTLVKLSGDGRFVTFVDRTGDGQILRRQRIDMATPEDVTAWPSATMNYQVSRDGSSFLLLGHGDSDAPSLSFVSKSIRNSRPVNVDGTIAGFGNASPDDFVVLVQDKASRLHVLHIGFDTGTMAGTENLGESVDVAFDGRAEARAVQTARDLWMPLGAAARMPTRIPSSAHIIAASNDGKSLWFTDVDDNGFKVLRILDTESQKWSLASRANKVDVSWTTFNPTTGALDGYVEAEAAPRWVTTNGAGAGADIRHLSKVLLGAPYIVSRSDDDRMWLVASMSSQTPVNYYVYDRFNHKLSRIFSARSTVPDALMPASIARWIRSPDGTRIQALVSPPSAAACQGERCPFVVKVHGGPHRRDDLTFDPETYWLQSLGYWVLRVNFRGSTGFGDEFANASDREWGRKVIDDIASSIDWFKQTFPVDGTKGAAMGGSFGGFASIALATRYPNSVSCAASLNGGGDLEAFATLLPKRQPHMAAVIQREVGNTLVAADIRDIREQSPINHIAKAKARFLIEYGARDTVSVSEESSRFAESLRKGSKHVAEAVYHTEGHELVDTASRQYHFRLLAGFLESCFEGAPLDGGPVAPQDVSFHNPPDPYPTRTSP